MKHTHSLSILLSIGKARPLGVLACLLVILGNHCESPTTMNQSDNQVNQAVLSIALQDGFEGEPVVVRVNGKEVYRKNSVQTDYRISLADSFEVPLPDDPITVEVELPQRNARATQPIEAEGTVYVGVSWLEGKLQFRISDTPFGYL